jgi:hypothetical protein
MKLVHGHDEGEGNSREEVTINSQRAYVIAWFSQLLPPLHSRFFSKVAMTLPNLLAENGYPKSGMSFVKPFGELKSKLFSQSVLKFTEFDEPYEVYTGRVILYWRSINASWITIISESMKLNGCQMRQPTHEE